VEFSVNALHHVAFSLGPSSHFIDGPDEVIPKRALVQYPRELSFCVIQDAYKTLTGMKDGASDMRTSVTRRPTPAPIHVKFDSSWHERFLLAT
jgi:hypothetical protein